MEANINNKKVNAIELKKKINIPKSMLLLFLVA